MTFFIMVILGYLAQILFFTFFNDRVNIDLSCWTTYHVVASCKIVMVAQQQTLLY